MFDDGGHEGCEPPGGQPGPQGRVHDVEVCKQIDTQIDRL